MHIWDWYNYSELNWAEVVQWGKMKKWDMKLEETY